MTFIRNIERLTQMQMKIFLTSYSSELHDTKSVFNDQTDGTISLFVCFLGVTTLCGCIFHSPVAGFSLLILEVS
jgi:hypothetical protein